MRRKRCRLTGLFAINPLNCDLSLLLRNNRVTGDYHKADDAEDCRSKFEAFHNKSLCFAWMGDLILSRNPVLPKIKSLQKGIPCIFRSRARKSFVLTCHLNRTIYGRVLDLIVLCLVLELSCVDSAFFSYSFLPLASAGRDDCQNPSKYKDAYTSLIQVEIGINLFKSKMRT